MDIYKLKFTILQQEIFRFLCLNAGKAFTARSLARRLEVSPTAVAKSLPLLKKENVVVAEKDDESGRLAIELNLGNKKIINYKRAENLKLLYESGLVDFLLGKFPRGNICLVGDYSLGTDRYDSDIEIAVGSGAKKINLGSFEKNLGRNISVKFYNPSKTSSALKKEISQGIPLSSPGGAS